MAISRPILIALIAALLALAAFYATSGARQSSEAPSAPASAAPERSASPTKSAPPARAKAREPGSRRGGDGSAKPPRSPAKRRPAVAVPTGMPAGVRRALAGKRTVVLFFFQRGSADDAATARAVASLRGRRGAQVFSAPISRLADYQAVIGGLGVTQAPSVVIVGRDRAARLIEGFVDAETLAQQVADAR